MKNITTTIALALTILSTNVFADTKSDWNECLKSPSSLNGVPTSRIGSEPKDTTLTERYNSAKFGYDMSTMTRDKHVSLQKGADLALEELCENVHALEGNEMTPTLLKAMTFCH